MTYTKTTWTNSSGQPISAANLNKIEQGIYDASLRGENVFHVSEYGAVGDGITNDTAAINSAITACSTAGGGVVVFDGKKNYAVARYTSGSQGPSLVLKSGVSLEGNNCKLVLIQNAAFIGSDVDAQFGAQSDSTLTKTVTAAITYGARTVTVNNTTSFTVGDSVGLRLGQSPDDANESLHIMRAKITALTSTTITLDRPILASISSGDLAATSVHKMVTKLINAPTDGFVRNFRLSVDPTGGLDAEAGIYMVWPKNFLIENIHGNNTGIHLTIGYPTDVTIRNCGGVNMQNVNNHPSKSRIFTLWAPDSVLLDGIYGEDFTQLFGMVEFSGRDVVLRNPHIRDTSTVRNRALYPLFMINEGSEIRVENLLWEGESDGVLVDTGGTSYNSWNFRDTSVRLNGDARWTGLTEMFSGYLNYQVSGSTTTTQRSTQRRFLLDRAQEHTYYIPLTNSMNGTEDAFAPPGLLISASVYASPNVAVSSDITGLYIGRTGNFGLDLKGSLVAGSVFKKSYAFGSYQPEANSYTGPVKIAVYTAASGVSSSDKFLIVKALVAPYEGMPTQTLTATQAKRLQGVEDHSTLPVNVKWYGATGNGVTDDTAAIEAAWAYASTQAPAQALYFPTGQYVYTGSGLIPSTGWPAPEIFGDGMSQTVILLGATSYLLAPSGVLWSTYVADMTIQNGKGAFKHTYTGSNVINHYVFERIAFVSYTECAVASDASDMPYWRFKDCIFNAASTDNTIGLALPSNSDQTAIDGCSFLRNKIHIKGRQGLLTTHIRGCDFIRFSATRASGPCIDIWVVPHTSNVNSGHGMTVSESKFGNENLVAGDRRVLIADEGTGATNGIKMPVTGSASTGIVNGHTFSDCFVGSADVGAMPFIYSTTPNVRAFRVGPMVYDSADTIIEFLNPSSVPPDRNGSMSIVGPLVSQVMATEQLPAPKVSNVPGWGMLIDPTRALATRPDVALPHGGGSSASFKNILTPTSISGLTTSSATNTAKTDALGGSDAGQLAFSTANTGSASGALIAMTVGLPAWLEVDVAAPDTGTPLPYLVITIADTGGTVIHLRRTVEVPAAALGWVTYRFSVVPRTVGTSASVSLANPFAGGFTGNVKVGRLRVYHSNEPILGGRRPTVSGSRGGNAALASLLTQLAANGLIVDSTT